MSHHGDGSVLDMSIAGGDISSRASWANPEDGDALSIFKKEVMVAMEYIGSRWGGPAQYLRSEIRDIEAINSFSRWLLDTFPLCADTYYNCEQNIPAINEEEMAMTLPSIIHVSTLSFSMDASIKPYPDRTPSRHHGPSLRVRAGDWWVGGWPKVVGPINANYRAYTHDPWGLVVLHRLMPKGRNWRQLLVH